MPARTAIVATPVWDAQAAQVEPRRAAQVALPEAIRADLVEGVRAEDGAAAVAVGGIDEKNCLCCFLSDEFLSGLLCRTC